MGEGIVPDWEELLCESRTIELAGKGVQSGFDDQCLHKGIATVKHAVAVPQSEQLKNADFVDGCRRLRRRYLFN